MVLDFRSYSILSIALTLRALGTLGRSLSAAALRTLSALGATALQAALTVRILNISGIAAGHRCGHSR